MKLNEMVYTRPDLEAYYAFMTDACERFKQADTAEIQIKIWEEVNAQNEEIQCMSTLMSIRNSINSNDEFYKKENEFFISEIGKLNQIKDEFFKVLLNSSFRKELEEKFGSLVFAMFEQSRKTFSPEIMDDLVTENTYSDEYDKLRSNAKVEFRGSVYTLPEMEKFTNSLDEEERHEAFKAVALYFADYEAEYDQIYDKLVKVRASMASKLGYDNFVQMAYDRLGRLDYKPEDIKKYREQIVKYVVPINTELYKRQAKRIGKEKLQYLDESLYFLNGNPTPKGDLKELVTAAQKMYRELSSETGEFFDMMVEEELLDLPSRPGKQPGGYCTFIPKYKKPFIFANFNQTAHDVDVLTHEAGHAFQVYSSKHQILPEYLWPTFEACEIHSMSMEFFAWPWMELFFKDDTAKYYFKHLTHSILFLPYGALVDHFQEEVFKNPFWTPEERKECYSRLEKIYLPHRDYTGLDFLKKGTFWYKQGHIFSSPFYYIDYTLAQVCALQYWVRDRKNHEEAWSSYLALCKLGGSQTFLELLKSSSLDNPFEAETFEKVFADIKEYLASVDDNSF